MENKNQKLKNEKESIMEITEEMFLNKPIMLHNIHEYKIIPTDFPFITIRQCTNTKDNYTNYEIVVKHLCFKGDSYIATQVIPQRTIKSINYLYQVIARFYKGIE